MEDIEADIVFGNESERYVMHDPRIGKGAHLLEKVKQGGNIISRGNLGAERGQWFVALVIPAFGIAESDRGYFATCCHHLRRISCRWNVH